ncbi:MAG: ribose 5-phosphate isomerase B [Erysipelotrichaceae bacterium]|nr:ribose 5-phosphate isomerase B [Erysipelotrichaceae bacterium]
MRIAMGNDHSAVDLKKEIKEYIEQKYQYEVLDFGTNSYESFDYPIAGEQAANAVRDGQADLGIVICGTGVGISLACNKVSGIRCVCCSEPYSAKMGRNHNNANMLAFGARVVGAELAKMIVDAFLTNEFEGGRHARRVGLIMDIEERNRGR